MYHVVQMFVVDLVNQILLGSVPRTIATLHVSLCLKLSCNGAHYKHVSVIRVHSNELSLETPLVATA